MTPADAGTYDKHLKALWRDNLLSGTDLGVLTTMLWGLRSKGRSLTQATIEQIMRKTGRSRGAVVQAIRRAIAVGVLEKFKQTVRRAIGARVRTVNAANIYVFRIVSQSANETTNLKANKYGINILGAGEPDDEPECEPDGEPAPNLDAPVGDEPGPVVVVPLVAGRPETRQLAGGFSDGPVPPHSGQRGELPDQPGDVVEARRDSAADRGATTQNAWLWGGQRGRRVVTRGPAYLTADQLARLRGQTGKPVANQKE